ncbi:HDHD1 [Bugula neritina]|uniref:HDHD1 n=1 Tax=Bugula neritina TaxID=10212 RepID=A0A7J7K8I9_BUGNE|nr:HDHD1 [Bugula neritina]
MMGTAKVDSTKLLIDHFNLPLSGRRSWLDISILREFQIAVATGSSEKKYDLKITHHKELFSLFSHVVFASDDPEVRQGKPCPDVFTVCAKRFPSPLPASPSNVLVFEDAHRVAALTVVHCSQVMLISRSYLLHHVKVSYYHNI